MLYEGMRRRLAEVLGVDPGPGLGGMLQRVLRQDSQLTAPTTSVVPASFPPGDDSRGPGSSALPVPCDSFLGRQDELVAVGKALRAARVVTLTGPGGSGKTR